MARLQAKDGEYKKQDLVTIEMDETWRRADERAIDEGEHTTGRGG